MFIVIPMAGRSSRFQKVGITTPKPLIRINGVSVIEIVIKNLNLDGKFIFICQKSHYEKYDFNPWNICLEKYFCVKDFKKDFQIEWEKLENQQAHKNTFNLLYNDCVKP